MLARFIGPLVAIVVASVAVPSARALDTSDLAGWWIAIDRAFPTLWERGDIVAMEELLIISPDGRAENRGMGFYTPDCRPGDACTDAPLIAAARLTLRGDLLTVSDRKESRGRINSEKADPVIRRIAVTGTPAWTATLDKNFLILRAATGNATRAFARIEPNRLRRLRAGLMIIEQSAARHWRCFFANATANDPAFAALSADSRSAPSFLNDYLRIASYHATLDTLGSMPTADHPDAQQRALARSKAEIILVETFPDIPAPKSSCRGTAAPRRRRSGRWAGARPPARRGDRRRDRCNPRHAGQRDGHRHGACRLCSRQPRRRIGLVRCRNEAAVLPRVMRFSAAVFEAPVSGTGRLCRRRHRKSAPNRRCPRLNRGSSPVPCCPPPAARVFPKSRRRA